MHRRDRVFLDAAFELVVDQALRVPVPHYCGIAALFGAYAKVPSTACGEKEQAKMKVTRDIKYKV
jgi:hypothetical protein